MESKSPLESFLDALFPPGCPVCGEGVEGGGPCELHAWRSSTADPRCRRCAVRISVYLPDGHLCPRCVQRPPFFERTLALGDYGPRTPLRDWILALKHGGRRELADSLGRAMAELVRREQVPLSENLQLVPVPLHPLRLLERGYDQAGLLAGSVAGELGLEVLHALRRRRWTDPQGTPGRESRHANVEGVFELRRRAARRLGGSTICLVDDVLTSGATASACARSLRAGGAARVVVLVVARAHSTPGLGFTPGKIFPPLGVETSP